MSLTPEQTASAQAWERVFEDSAQTTVVLDEMTVFANTLPSEHQAGAAKLLLWILLRRSALRRAKIRTKGAS